ncbi:hypothetical protein PACTADRAFT_3168 [Pachysolen tannophilus NRRL Y-2460]|uniref:Uncharacterized protein n=1 Tax=Pachysolen tannophilus NRRL Y-2460 TaxID=669874 RepID=A0A1E4TUS4_PACTA|nr:hypothetical protein PACTADRAFT_3168 [Pachysolen tannophilus NRRL Y-2460]
MGWFGNSEAGDGSLSIKTDNDNVNNNGNNSSSATNVSNKGDINEVSEFINQEPRAVYIIDGDRDAPHSIICRDKASGGGQTCIKLQYNCIELFKAMQKFNYFCALPSNKVDATYFECRKIS